MGANAQRRRQTKTLAKTAAKMLGPGQPVPAWMKMTETQAAEHHRQLLEAAQQPPSGQSDAVRDPNGLA